MPKALRSQLVEFIEGLSRDELEQTLDTAGTEEDRELVDAVLKLQSRLRSQRETVETAQTIAEEHTRRIQSLANNLAAAITDRNRAEAAHREATEFAYIASHDLKQPLCTILSFSELLHQEASGKLGKEEQEWLGFILEGSQRAAGLVDDLLTYARVGHTTTETRPLNSDEAVASALDNLHQAIEQSEAKVEVTALPRVEADPTQLVQLFQNLISNALKFRGNRPARVQVTAEEFDDKVQFTVADQGIGIPQDQMEKAFGLFTRLHVEPMTPGSGMGLAICQRIVDRHGGRIWIESTEGAGTRVHFTLTLHRPE